MRCNYCAAVIPDGSWCCPACGNQFSSTAYGASQYNNAYYQQPSYYGNSTGYNYSYGGNQQYGYQPYGYQQAPNNSNINYVSERVLTSDADEARTLAIVGLVCALFTRLVGLILGIVAISKANKCLRVRNDANFQSAKNIGIAAVVANAALMLLSIIIPIILFAMNSSLIYSLFNYLGLSYLF